MPSSGYTAISFTAGEQPTTAKWSLVGSNDASFNTGNGFNDGILAQRHFATNSVPALALDTAAITQDYQSLSSAAVGTSEVQVGSTTFTMPAGGRRLLILWYGTVTHTSNATFTLRIRQTNISGTVLVAKSAFVASPTATEDATVLYSGVPSSGSQTYVVTCQAPSSGGTFQGGFLLPIVI